MPFFRSAGWLTGGRFEATRGVTTMLIFLVGPSGAGKSFLLDKIKAEFNDARIVDLDVEENEAISEFKRNEINNFMGWEGRWERSLAVLNKIEVDSGNEGKLFLVDVGAGCLQTEAAFKYFADRREFLILINAKDETLCARRGRGASDLKEKEFTTRHYALYQQISRAVDNTAEESSKAQTELVAHINDISFKNL